MEIRHKPSLLRVDNIFFDFDGVLNDVELMNRELRRLIAERMDGEWGGGVENWLASVHRAFEVADRSARGSHLREENILEWLGEYDRIWLETLFSAGGLEPPTEGASELGWRIREEAYANIDSIYPEARQALEILKGRPGSGQAAAGPSERSLYLASGGRTARLDTLLKKAGLRGYFLQLFGCDTVNIVKESPEYYRRIFQRLGVAPTLCLVVDDNPDCIQWAHHAGAAAALLDRNGDAPPSGPVLLISDLLQLAQALQAAESR